MASEYVEARIREARLILATPEAVAAELKNYGEKLRLNVGLMFRTMPWREAFSQGLNH